MAGPGERCHAHGHRGGGQRSLGSALPPRWSTPLARSGINDPRRDRGQIDFTYIDDAITATEALAILTASAPARDTRTATLEAEGLPAYTTSAGWLGYDDEKVERLVRRSVAAGFTMLKLKVGTD